MNKWNTDPVYPFDGNAINIMCAATVAMRKAGATTPDVDEYLSAATSGDYDNLLRVTMENVDLRAGYSDEDEEMCEYCGDTLFWCGEECDGYR
jgi:hypothetical protein